MVFLIGLAGDSGTGKTSFARLLAKVWGHVSHISLDDYHKYGREERKQLGITPLNPNANDFDLMYRHLAAIKRGESVVKPVYDHHRGVIVPDAERFVPDRVVVVEGLLPFYDRRIAELFDIKLFFDVSARVKLAWKLERDRKQRGYVKQFDLDARKRDFRRSVLPQRERADIVFRVANSRRFRRALETRLVYRQGILERYPLDLRIFLSGHRYVFEFEDGALILDGRFPEDVFREMLPDGAPKLSSSGLVTSFTAAQLVFGKQVLERWLQ